MDSLMNLISQISPFKKAPEVAVQQKDAQGRNIMRQDNGQIMTEVSPGVWEDISETTKMKAESKESNDKYSSALKGRKYIPYKEQEKLSGENKMQAGTDREKYYVDLLRDGRIDVPHLHTLSKFGDISPAEIDQIIHNSQLPKEQYEYNLAHGAGAYQNMMDEKNRSAAQQNQVSPAPISNPASPLISPTGIPYVGSLLNRK